jgi:hypothetical protein
VTVTPEAEGEAGILLIPLGCDPVMLAERLALRAVLASWLVSKPRLPEPMPAAFMRGSSSWGEAEVWAKALRSRRETRWN